ncbi:MAG: FtsX-like permease family protein [Cetobacterium sp.]|uniref:ABC transporter permease n=1 Tax=Cetobacterium sp. TaxID=2071632 RepID=UPI002FCA9EAD
MKFWMAYRLLLGNRGRALFPLGGVIVGAMALIMTLSLGEGAKNIIDKDLSAIGSNRILVGAENLGSRDLEIIERLPFVEYGVFPEKRESVENIIFKGYSKKALYAMGLPDLQENEVVLDKSQFHEKKVGELIELETGNGKRIFRIRDLYQELSPFETMKLGDRVIVGDKTFEKIFGRRDYKSLVISFPQDEDGVEYIPVILRELNRSRLSYGQVRLLETPDVYRKVERIKTFVSKSLFILSFISLIVGGIGVLNLIGASVRERGSYIGILRTMGMGKRVLIEIFLLEGAIVVGFGSIVGVLLGVVMSYVAGVVINIPPYFSLVGIVMAMIVTMGVGLVFGVFPAKKVGELEIVEALKV